MSPEGGNLEAGVVFEPEALRWGPVTRSRCTDRWPPRPSGARPSSAGPHSARITFWLKLEEALAFGAMILALDRLLRRDPAMRLRAHLLWSVNPLLLWEVVAGGDIDGLAAVFGLLGVAALRTRPPWTEPGPGHRAQDQTWPRAAIGLGTAAAAGLLIGVATAIKVEYALLAVAVAWACRRSSRGSGALGGVVPPELTGPWRPPQPASGSWSSRLTWPPGLPRSRCSSPAAPGSPGTPCTSSSGDRCSDTPSSARGAPRRISSSSPTCCSRRWPWWRCSASRIWSRAGLAVAPALALSLAWLFVTAFQRPWYDVMAVSLLALYPASWLDWVVLVRLFAGATVYAQAVQSPAEPQWLYDVAQFNGAWLTPGIRLLAAVAFVWFCVSGRRGRSRSGASSGRLPELLPTT